MVFVKYFFWFVFVICFEFKICVNFIFFKVVVFYRDLFEIKERINRINFEVLRGK